MRFHLGPIPDEFVPDSSWRPIREPGPVLLQFLALPIGLGGAWGVAFCWQRLGVPALHLPGSQEILLAIAVFLSLPVLIVVHELLHAVVHPGFGRSPATVLGAWPRRLLFYAHYSGPLTRERFLLVFATPFLGITALPLAFASVGGIPPYWTLAAAWFSTWNALFACGDCFGFALILCQVPRGASVQNQGWRTYWK